MCTVIYGQQVSFELQIVSFFSIKKLFPFVLFILLEIKTTAYGKTIFVDSYILIKKITRQYFQRVRMTFMISMSKE